MSNESLAPSFDEIRGILKELSVGQKEFRADLKELSVGQKEFRVDLKDLQSSQKDLQSSQKEFRVDLKDLQSSQKETDQKVKEVSQQIAKNNKGLNKAKELFETQWGRLVESLVKGKLLSLLNERGIEVQNLSQGTETSYTKEDGQIQQKEFDIIAVNGDEVVAVEVKTTLTPEKVNYFIESLKDFKKYFSHYQALKIYGAVAYLKSESEAHLFAQRQGLFVIRATGDSASIINTKDFKPKAFA